ncbi:hypothetical protein GO988_08610 [Hymenobacter sp. HMF4947]|uniref:CBM-cenC domain-containing protein n=1 Tax=Hymenobacter ginkgonis TaxID=2682976 RepID=A0A7K1TDD7_9BACT|nr:hypothetical protein [Hymenobacter ginkgonis]MVN76384.1 hypothetical protein [Hymenobacter ginkgonis]
MTSLFSWRGRLLAALVGSLGLLAAGCGGKSDGADADGKVLLRNDFDNLAGWLGTAPQPSLTRERAHSGQYSIKVDANTEFSLGYASTLGQMSEERITKIKVDAWVLAPNAEAGGLLVTHVGDAPPATKPMLWDGFDVVQAANQKYGDWAHVSKVIDIPAEANANTNFGIYLWRNKGNATTYIDDLVITVAP